MRTCLLVILCLSLQPGLQAHIALSLTRDIILNVLFVLAILASASASCPPYVGPEITCTLEYPLTPFAKHPDNHEMVRHPANTYGH